MAIKTMQLTGDWKLRGFAKNQYSMQDICAQDFDCSDWYRVSVPGDVHSTLMREGIIPDPHYGYQDRECAWVEELVWIYRMEFEPDGAILQSVRQELVLEGLDTYATVYLNGEKLGNFRNMFVPHRCDVSALLCGEKNTLVVEFPILREQADRELPEGFWTNYSTERAYARKAGYSFGWDWCPRMATIGIWKPVHLHAYGQARLEDVHIHAESIDCAGLTALLCVDITPAFFAEAMISYRVIVRDGERELFREESASSSIQFAMEGVKLWWTNDLGDAHLYTVETQLLVDGAVVDSAVHEYGIRDLRVVEQGENGEPRFLFVLNNIPLFARGVNWVPVSSFPGAADDSHYERLLSLTQEAGMNMLSLWGGGIYEKDIFYQLCDNKGILVWQYFMFACGEYPDYDPQYVADVREEVFHAVRRLRNTTCVAAWVGNVEGRQIAEKIGLGRPNHGDKLFEQMIPAWLDELGETRFYAPSSPWGGELANSMEAGDRHNWDVWFNNIPYTEYSKDTSTFVSEFGIHSASNEATIRKYMGEEAERIDSYAFHYMNKDQALGNMRYLLEQESLFPKTLSEYVDATMLVQAEALKFAVEHFRRRFPATGGALIWQLNDCWPVHSWSMVDYDLIPKAAYYYAKRFCAPVLISLQETSNADTAIWVINHTQKPLDTVLHVSVRDFFGSKLHEVELPVSVPANSCQKIRDFAVGGRFYPNAIIPNRHRHFYLHAFCAEMPEGAFRFFGEKSDRLFPTATLTAEVKADLVTVSTDRFARFVKLDGDVEGLHLSDNYFDLQAGEGKTLSIRVLHGEPLANRKLYVKAWNSNTLPLHF